jgi:proline iminopeptidase
VFSFYAPAVPAASVGGTRISFEVDGAGPPLLVLHGGLGVDHHVYRATLQPLAEGHTLVFPDHRHNGRSGRPGIETVTMAQLADDAAGLADHLGHERFAVFGHSYGGFIAQELAIRHPDRVTRLVLATTTAGQLGAGEREEETEPGPDMPPQLIAYMATAAAGDAAFEEGMRKAWRYYFHRYDRSYDQIIDGTVFDAAACVRGFEVLAHWSSVDRLPQVRCPVLLLAGRHDVFASWPQSYRIARHLADASVVVFEHSGHWPWIEEPAACFDAVRGFLLPAAE